MWKEVLMNQDRLGKEDQSLRKKAFLAIFFTIINAIGTGLLALYIDQRSIWLTILIVLGGGLYTLTLRCPNCGAPMYKRKTQILGMDFTYWGGFTIPKNCSHCGTKF